ncbi:MAG: amidohydrolase family protein [Akkermansiaceae bacterium]
MLDAHVMISSDQDLENLDDDLSLSGVSQIIALCENLSDIGVGDLGDDGLVAAILPRAQFESKQFRVQLDACEHHSHVNGLWANLDDVSTQGISFLTDLGFTLDVISRADEIRQVIELADLHPQLKFAWHCTGGLQADQARNIRELARRPQVYCKLSNLILDAPGADCAVDKPLTESVREVFSILLENFTAARLMYASGWGSGQRGMANVTYPAWLNTVDDLIHNLPADMRMAISSETAEEFYRLDL